MGRGWPVAGGRLLQALQALLVAAVALTVHRPAVALAVTMAPPQAQPPNLGGAFTVAHIASPLIRRRLPGHPPSPETRSRISMQLLAAALAKATESGADAIVVTGSVLSAPSPLRNCDAHGYYKLDREEPLAEAEADYAEVRALLEGTGLPFEVTPGGEDCLEAFSKMNFSTYVGEDSLKPNEKGEQEWPMVDPAAMEDPAAKAIADFGAQLARERAAGQKGAATGALQMAAQRGGQEDLAGSAPGIDVEDVVNNDGKQETGCNACGADGGCGSGEGHGKNKKKGKDGKTEEERKAEYEQAMKTRLLKVPINSTHERGWATPEDEYASSVVLARFCDHVPLSAPPQRLEFERRLWEGLLASADHAAQCHVQTFSTCDNEVVDEEGNAKVTPGRKKRKQDEGESGLDGALFFEHKDLRRRMEASSKFILSLSTLPARDSHTGARVHGGNEGRVTFLQTPSLSVYPHRFTLNTLSAPSVSIDPRLSQSKEVLPRLPPPPHTPCPYSMFFVEITAKADVIQHRHFWGHEEIECGGAFERGGDRVVFLDRDGVINTLAKYTTGPALMHLVEGAAGAICRLKAAGFKVVVVSTQSCVARGYVTTAHVHSVMDRMCRLLREQAARELGPGSDDPDLAQPDCIIFSVGCDRQAMHSDYEDVSDAKPRAAGLIRALQSLRVDRASETFRGYMVGDRETDIGAGVAAGCKPLLVRTGQGKETEASMEKKGAMGRVFGVAASIVGAVDLILADQGPG